MHSSFASAVLLGLGVARGTELLKEIIPFTMPRAHVAGFATALSIGAAVVLCEDWRERVLVGAGAAGTSMLVHHTASLLSALGDRQRVIVMRSANQPNRRTA
jgi:hypothetical protein